MAIYDTMRYIKPAVQTICFGMAMSMGAILLAGGAPGKRVALQNAKIMIHQGTSGFQGQATDIEIHAREVLAVRARMDEVLAETPARRWSRSTRTPSATTSSAPSRLGTTV